MNVYMGGYPNSGLQRNFDDLLSGRGQDANWGYSIGPLQLVIRVVQNRHAESKGRTIGQDN